MAQKDFNLPKHREIDTKNLYVCDVFPQSDLAFFFLPPTPSVTISVSPCTQRKEKNERKKRKQDRTSHLLTQPFFSKVIKACQSLTSRGYLKTQFSWQWYYYTLTPEGLDYLREWLHVPAEIVPATHIKQQRSHAPPRGMMGGDDRGDRRPGGGRGGPPRGDREGGYRRRDAGGDAGKEGGAPGEFAPTFRGGFGRGRGAPPPTS